MKHTLLLTTLCIPVVFATAQTQPKQKNPSGKPPAAVVTDAAAKPKLNYETVPNDPYKTRIYTLSNGLKVYLSVYKSAPRIQTFIAVRAGSKNDPHDATGLAHYLEHMVFKGSDQFGTKDFGKESEQIQKIEDLYEVYRGTKDEAKRKVIYHQIDSISGEASKYAIANEYDKMLAGIGAQGTNAYTSFDETVYVNDIPSNQVDNWLEIEAERFRKPVLRLFHTELEAVYEEKNRTLDNDGDKAWQAMMESLFQKHTYGTQTTIGTIEHLKNPSMKEIMKYYNKNYVPNNMAIIMSGDFDPDKTIQQIEKRFGKMPSKPVEPYKFEKEAPITTKITKEVTGPDAANILMGWRFAGAGTKEADLITLLNGLLSNGKAGLLDLNLNQAQKVLSSGTYAYVLKDYSTFLMFGEPKKGQALEDIEKLLYSQIDKVRNGEFDEWLMKAVITDLKLQKTKELENNQSRASAMVHSFVNQESWQETVSLIERLSKITKQEVTDFVKANFNPNNYAVVYKRTGESKAVEKVEKPAITPVEVDRTHESPFVKKIMSAPAAPIQPVFIDYDKDIMKGTIKSSIEVIYNKNTENLTFDLFYVFDMGTANDKLLKVAIEYLPYVGTSKMSPAQIKEELYKLGCSFNVFVGPDQTWVSLNGLSDNFDKALELFETILNDPKVEEASLKNLIADILKKRDDAKLNKSIILQQAMLNYAVYGPVNPLTYILNTDELNKLTIADVASKLKSLEGFQHEILYYGPKELSDLKTSLNNLHVVPSALKPVPAEHEFKYQEFGNTVYVTDYDMKQVEIVMLSKGNKFDTSLWPVVSLYNNYFGGGMSSVVFQDLRESKALAYSAYSVYRNPNKPTRNFINYSYIGSQADKLSEALKGMSDLLDVMPKADASFNAAKELLIQDIESERIIKSDILFNYENARKFGIKYDIRKDVFEKGKTMTYDDIKKFQENYIKGKPRTVLVLGKKDALDTKVLEKYGSIKYLTLTDIFGF
ncbi:MAG: M16 family metallopeptidase [Bacteroidia bacterium]